MPRPRIKGAVLLFKAKWKAKRSIDQKSIRCPRCGAVVFRVRIFEFTTVVNSKAFGYLCTECGHESYLDLEKGEWIGGKMNVVFEYGDGSMYHMGEPGCPPWDPNKTQLFGKHDERAKQEVRKG